MSIILKSCNKNSLPNENVINFKCVEKKIIIETLLLSGGSGKSENV